MERAMKAPHTPAPFGMEAAVIGDTAGDERVRKLEKDSGAPGEQEDHFSLKLPSDGLESALARQRRWASDEEVRQQTLWERLRDDVLS
jgi:hypothetical protein